MYYDSGYLMVMLVGALLVFLPQLWVKHTVSRFDAMDATVGLTGAQFARQMLEENRVMDVVVEETPGELSDHYDPGAKAVRLSSANYHHMSVTALTIAAHEVGHAIQHANGFQPVIWRSALVPVVNIGSQFGPMLIMIGLGMGVMSSSASGGDLGILLAWLGVLAFSLSTLFHLVTLPVEIDASSRALRVLEKKRYMNSEQLSGAKQVLTAAAFTYVATALYSLIQVLYWAMRILGARERRAY